jgi:hypothetical protein
MGKQSITDKGNYHEITPCILTWVSRFEAVEEEWKAPFWVTSVDTNKESCHTKNND